MTNEEQLDALEESIRATINLGMKLFDLRTFNELTEIALGTLIQQYGAIMDAVPGGKNRVDDLVVELTMFAEKVGRENSVRLEEKV